MDELKLQEYVVSLRRHFHRYPELGLCEWETAEKIREELNLPGIEFIEIKDCKTAVAADLKPEGKSEGMIVLRADIDALPILEETGLAFASEREGVMHACGHDAHTAMLLGAAKLLYNNRKKLKKTVRFIFEPAEEFAGAGRQLIANGVLKGAESIFAMHVLNTIPSGQIGIKEGPCMMGAVFFSIKLHGKGGHGASPDQGIDTIPALSAIIMNLQTVVSREISPIDTGVISIGTVHAGVSANVLAEDAELTGTMRFYSEEAREKLMEAMPRIVKATAAAYRVEVEIGYRTGLPPVMNHPEYTKIAETAAENILGNGCIRTDRTFLGSDDYAFYLQEIPGVYAFLGTGNADLTLVSAHNCRFSIEEEPLGKGAQIYAEYVWLNQ